LKKRLCEELDCEANILYDTAFSGKEALSIKEGVMAKDSSFDVVSEVDLQTIDDVINVALKEINNRFDLKNTGAKIEFNRGEKKVTIHAPSEFQLGQIKDILKQKMAKRDVSSKCLRQKALEKATGDTVREINDIVYGIPQDLAKSMVKDIKGLKLKRLNASIQDTKIRIASPSKDDLQQVMAFIKEKDYPVPLQFNNYR
jgi:uncharacterized protein YajQ (UPF0234 family)